MRQVLSKARKQEHSPFPTRPRKKLDVESLSPRRSRSQDPQVQKWPGLQNTVCWEGKGRKGKGQWRCLTAHIWESIPGTQVSLFLGLNLQDGVELISMERQF